MTTCTATRTDGKPCRAHAIRGTDPPRCAAHSRNVGAPAGNQNRVTHGAYRTSNARTLADLINDLTQRLHDLNAYIDTHATEPELYARLVALHGQIASRIGRLIRDQQAIAEAAGGDMDAVIQAALDLVSGDLEADL